MSATATPLLAQGTGDAGVSGIPRGPGNVGGLNNSLNDPSGVGNAAKTAPPPMPSMAPPVVPSANPPVSSERTFTERETWLTSTPIRKPCGGFCSPESFFCSGFCSLGF